MKQGKASRDVSESYKRDPRANAMNVKGVSQIGTSLGNHITDSSKILKDIPQPLHAGRGFNSPIGARGEPGVGKGGRTLYRKGSQGRS